MLKHRLPLAALCSLLVVSLALAACAAPPDRSSPSQQASQVSQGEEQSLSRHTFVAGLGPIGAMAAEDEIVVAGAGLFLIQLDASASPPMVVARSDRLPGLVEDVVLGDGHAFVALGADGLAIVHLTSGERLSLASTLELDGAASELLWHDGRLYVAAGAGGLHVLDVSDPASPQLLGSSGASTNALLGHAIAIAWHAGRLVVVGGQALAVVEVDDPSAPLVQAFYDFEGLSEEGVDRWLPNFRMDVVVQGDRAYLPHWPPLAFDLSTDGAVTFSGESAGEGLEPCWSSMGSILEGYDDHLVMGGEAAVFTFGLEDPDRPVPLNQVGIDEIESIAPSTEGLLVSSVDGLVVVRAPQDMRAMVQRGCVDLSFEEFGSDGGSLHVSEGLGVLISGSSSDFAVLDLSDPTRAQLATVTRLTTEIEVCCDQDVHFIGDHAVLGASSVEGSRIVLERWDLSNPQSPSAMARLVLEPPDPSVERRISALESGGDLLFVFGEDHRPGDSPTTESWLEVLDLADPANLRSLSHWTVADRGHAGTMRWGGEGVLWLTVTDPSHDSPDALPPQPGLLAVNVSDPLAPEIVGSLAPTDASGAPLVIPQLARLVIEQDYAFVGIRDGLVVVDISDSTMPILNGIVDVSCDLYSGFSVLGGQLICGRAGWVRAYDISVPEDSRLVAEAGGFCSHCEHVTRVDDVIYIFDLMALMVVDITFVEGGPRRAAEVPALGRKTLLGLGSAWGIVRYGGWPQQCGWLTATGEVAPIEADPDWACPSRMAAVPDSTLAVALTVADSSLSVLDMSGAEPRTLGSVHLKEQPGQGLFTGLSANARFAIAYGGPDGGALYIVGIEDPTAPEVLAVYPRSEFATLDDSISAGGGIPLSEEAAFLSLMNTRSTPDDPGRLTDRMSILAIDLRDPRHPRASGRLAPEGCDPNCGGSLRLMDDGRHLLLQRGDRPMLVMDVQDLERPRVVGEWSLPEGDFGQVATGGPWIWATKDRRPDTVYQYLLTDPAAPLEVSRRRVPVAVRELAAAGDNVFAMDPVAGPLRLSIGGGLRAGLAYLPALGHE